MKLMFNRGSLNSHYQSVNEEIRNSPKCYFILMSIVMAPSEEPLWFDSTYHWNENWIKYIPNPSIFTQPSSRFLSRGGNKVENF